MASTQIDFKFSRNWKKLLVWHDAYQSKAKCAPMWELQTEKIQDSFEKTVPNIINWKQLWKDFSVWFNQVLKKNEVVLWSEQKRELESIMLRQLSELNKEQFVLAFLHRGNPEVTMEKTSYWEALRLKEKFDGDSNGQGGNEEMDNITIVNLKNLIKC